MATRSPKPDTPLSFGFKCAWYAVKANDADGMAAILHDDFVLVIEVDHFQRSCHVIWRTATRLGVAFNTGA